MCPCGKDYVKAELAGKKCEACGYYIGQDATECAVCKKKADDAAKEAEGADKTKT